MITENLSTLKIHKLTQAQYDRELAAGNIDETALYLTPDEEIDMSGYVTKEYVDSRSLIAIEATLSVSNWVNSQQSLNIEGVGANSLVFVSPKPSESNYIAYTESCVRCVSQTNGQLMFSCTNAPVTDVVVNIVYVASNDAPESGTSSSEITSTLGIAVLGQMKLGG